ncbi:MAG: hypothetical protein FWE33_03030 [Defluviitaleaceae bacterium]|nr:hypothetical protein [Defluviitaleaceae bacterium]
MKKDGKENAIASEYIEFRLKKNIIWIVLQGLLAILALIYFFANNGFAVLNDTTLFLIDNININNQVVSYIAYGLQLTLVLCCVMYFFGSLINYIFSKFKFIYFVILSGMGMVVITIATLPFSGAGLFSLIMDMPMLYLVVLLSFFLSVFICMFIRRLSTCFP